MFLFMNVKGKSYRDNMASKIRSGDTVTQNLKIEKTIITGSKKVLMRISLVFVFYFFPHTYTYLPEP